MGELDTGIGSRRASRPSVFNPPSPIVDTPDLDVNVGVTPAQRENVFDPPPAQTVTLDTGDVL